jgi:hypothetical protein
MNKEELIGLAKCFTEDTELSKNILDLAEMLPYTSEKVAIMDKWIQEGSVRFRFEHITDSDDCYIAMQSKLDGTVGLCCVAEDTAEYFSFNTDTLFWSLMWILDTVVHTYIESKCNVQVNNFVESKGCYEWDLKLELK